MAKLGRELDNATRTVVKRGFMPGSPSDAETGSVATTLPDGFNKIAALCNSTQVIFSDGPINRMMGAIVSGRLHDRSDWEDDAFVDGDRTSAWMRSASRTRRLKKMVIGQPGMDGHADHPPTDCCTASCAPRTRSMTSMASSRVM